MGVVKSEAKIGGCDGMVFWEFGGLLFRFVVVLGETVLVVMVLVRAGLVSASTVWIRLMQVWEMAEISSYAHLAHERKATRKRQGIDELLERLRATIIRGGEEISIPCIKRAS